MCQKVRIPKILPLRRIPPFLKMTLLCGTIFFSAQSLKGQTDSLASKNQTEYTVPGTKVPDKIWKTSGELCYSFGKSTFSIPLENLLDSYDKTRNYNLFKTIPAGIDGKIWSYVIFDKDIVALSANEKGEVLHFSYKLSNPVSEEKISAFSTGNICIIDGSCVILFAKDLAFHKLIFYKDEEKKKIYDLSKLSSSDFFSISDNFLGFNIKRKTFHINLTDASISEIK